jgi:hypothetical protein
MRRFIPNCFAVAALTGLAGAAFAFDGHRVTEGPLTLTIRPLPVVTRRAAPQSVTVTLSNASASPLPVRLQVESIPTDFPVVGPATADLTLAAGQATETTFKIQAAARTYTAHYPVHARAQFGTNLAHAVLIFETDFRTEDAKRGTPAGGELIPVPAIGTVALAGLKTHWVTWQYNGQEPVRLPVGWQGTDPVSSASFSRGPMARGETRNALQMHPPYRPRPGSVQANYRVRLPATRPLKLSFHNAIRDTGPQEPASDGVTFRVRVNGSVVFERHTDSKAWVAGEVDLERLAGQTVVLGLESHPGPKNNTTCDSSFWGDPVIQAGDEPRVAKPAERAAFQEQARALAQAGTGDGVKSHVFELAGGGRAALILGPNGLADGALAFSQGGKVVTLAGLDITVQDQPVGRWPSGVVPEKLMTMRTPQGHIRIVQTLRQQEERFDLVTEAWSEGPALRVKVSSPRLLTDLAPGAADQIAPRVYFGHGYCVTDPAPFKVGGGGHSLSASHVGFDFENGLSLLMATDTPPDNLQVDPARRLYTLHTHPDATFTFLPGTRGAMDCALQYRPLFHRPAAPGFARKAGRFVFDFWGGNYPEDAALMRQAAAYGITNSILVMHVWQRWGYDYRLPDIFPPYPKLGSLADLQQVGEACRQSGILFGLHDNYIDFYPDADGYNYDDITFDAQGNPRKAWINNGRDAQSYQFRPDRLQPYLKRNLDLLVPALRPNAYFVDVFTSANVFDYHDREGQFHSRKTTQQAWGEAFASIRNRLGNDSTTISEAGDDFLIGWLDGADCQHLRITTRPDEFRLPIACRDWERIPWFDAVNHARFSLHGVGYSSRYQGARSRTQHGIESDDYLSDEILTGHALMSDLGMRVRGAARKYWLAQDFIESIARDDITNIAFSDNDLHRVMVSWRTGGKAWVNRGTNDWAVEGRVLPPFGYLARFGAGFSSVERVNGQVVEQSRAGNRWYAGGRGFEPDPPLPVSPGNLRLQPVGNRSLRLLMDWDLQGAIKTDLAVQVQLYKPQTSRLVKNGFTATTARPAVPTSQWRGKVTTGADWLIQIPAEMTAGDYEVLVTLVDTTERPPRRFRLLGDEDAGKRFRVGVVTLTGSGTNLTGAVLGQPIPSGALPTRSLANANPGDFGWVITPGAIRCQVEPAAGAAILTPLPETPAFPVRVVPARLGLGSVTQVVALDPQGKPLGTIPVAKHPDGISWLVDGKAFAYRVETR